ncbi:MAG: SDR family oxidoreductase [Chloroflexota bacterium]|nr:SDR family oxidoreductase [Chloroflexota bacterium]
MVDLTGKVALVTGASKGIGSELALTLARAGAAVVANFNTDEAGAQAVVEQIASSGGRAIAVGVDVAHVAGCRDLVKRAVEEFGRLDIACCHAGITSWGKFLDYTEEAFDAVVNTNLKGAYFTAQAAARQMVAQGMGGRIIITSSVTGNQAVPYLSAYAMTKGGLQMLTRNLVLELSPYNITINAVAPGAIINERNLADDPEYDAKWAGVVPLRRAGTPQDVAAAALFFASDEAAFITGTTLTVDGGWTCYSPTPDFEFVEREGRIGT